MRLEVGSRLGPYEITGWLGAGGMGEVYRARDTRLGREVAIKILPRDVIEDSERVARFRREACSASALNHRNIVTVHDFTAIDNDAWMVMELIRGESLRQLLARGPLPLKRVLGLASGMADGLSAAHAAGIVHRDLKPENVMITSDGVPKILDFGLVKQAALVSDPESPTDVMVSRAGMIMGTVAYMSPEQTRGESVDFRADQFALGVMLQEMVTGQHPFARSSSAATVAAILNEEPRPLGDHCPMPLAEVIERCLAKGPEDRYGSTSDLAHDIRRISGKMESHTAAPARRHARRWWWPVALAGIGLFALGAVTALIAPRRRAAADQSFELSVATPEFTHVARDEIALPVALSPNGRFLVVYGKGADAVQALWLHDLRTGAKRLLVPNAFSVGWSPDSRSVAYFADQKLKTVSVDGGPPRIICEARPEGIPSWRGNTILFAQYSTKEPGIYRVDAGGGRPELVAGRDPKRPRSLLFWPELLPDGKRFLYLMLVQTGPEATDIEHELYVGSLSGDPPRKVPAAIDSRALYANGNLLYVRDGTLLAQPFDPERVRFTGEPRPLVNNVHYFRSTGLASFSVSDGGVLAWRLPLGQSRLVWFDRAGTEGTQLGAAAFQPDGRLSPDGNRYAVGIVDPKQGVADVWIYDLLRASSERVTFALLDEKFPVWSNDKQSIYYRGDGAGPPDIFRWSPGAQRGELFFAGPGVEEPQDVSADGRWMLFVDRRQTSLEDIYVLPLNPKGAPRPFVVTPFDESSPRFSPDGRWVAYQSDVSGVPEVYVRAFEGGAASKVSSDGGTLPRWQQRDGKELFFLAPGGKIMSATMGDGMSSGIPKMLFQAPEAVNFEPVADGSRFLLQLEERASVPPVQVLINWPARMANERGQ